MVMMIQKGVEINDKTSMQPVLSCASFNGGPTMALLARPLRTLDCAVENRVFLGTANVSN
jgi:hypothetical protein